MNCRRNLFGSFVLLASVLALVAGDAPFAQVAPKKGFPQRRVEIIVPYAPGGVTDLTARALAVVLPDILQQPIVVVNKAGGARLEGGEYVARAKPDGYRCGLFPFSIAWPELHFKDVPYKSTDLTPVCQVIGIRQLIIVGGDSKYASLKDLVQDVTANPSLKVQFGVTGIGAVPHLIAVALGAQTGKSDQMTPIPFQGDAGVIKAILGKHVPAGVTSDTGSFAQIQAGLVRPLAITGENRWDRLPNVPTLDELGYKLGFGTGENTVYVPKGTAQEPISVLEQAIGKAVEHATFKSMAEKAGIPVLFKTQAEYLKTYETQKAALGRVIKDLGLLK